MVVLAVDVGDDTKRKTSSNYLCNDHMEAIANVVFA